MSAPIGARGREHHEQRQAGFGEHACGHGAHGEHRPDRDVDLSGKHHERHPGGDDEDREVREKEIDEIAAPEIFRARDCERRKQHRNRDGNPDLPAMLVHHLNAPEPSRARAPGWRPRATACRRSSRPASRRCDRSCRESPGAPKRSSAPPGRARPAPA